MLFFRYLLWFFLYSFVGWVYESILCSVEQRHPVNRGFLNGPLCPIYGSGAILFLLLLGRLKNPILIFVLGMLIASVLEYFTSWLMELIFHARWWDYSRMKCQLHGRICLIGAIIFGTFSVVLVKWLHPFVRSLTDPMPDTAVLLVSLFLLLLMLADTVYTGARVLRLRKRLEEFRGILEEKVSYTRNILRDGFDRFEELLASGKARTPGEAFLRMLNFQERRVLRAFPRFRLRSPNEVLTEIRSSISSRRSKK